MDSFGLTQIRNQKNSTNGRLGLKMGHALPTKAAGDINKQNHSGNIQSKRLRDAISSARANNADRLKLKTAALQSRIISNNFKHGKY